MRRPAARAARPAPRATAAAGRVDASRTVTSATTSQAQMAATATTDPAQR
ncbi:MAG TPA: hypothetical protein VL330_07355 [Actinomycetes bacterium]|nr:hypothetical protein [Actinomycetes bacterium]